ncbi:MAG: hypothetical protein ABL958_19435, partial [Bdellovibrionia bacterium]
LLILGLSAFIAPFAVEPRAFKRDGVVVLIATLAMIGVSMTGEFGRSAVIKKRQHQILFDRLVIENAAEIEGVSQVEAVRQKLLKIHLVNVVAVDQHPSARGNNQTCRDFQQATRHILATKPNRLAGHELEVDVFKPNHTFVLTK